MVIHWYSDKNCCFVYLVDSVSIPFPSSKLPQLGIKRDCIECLKIEKKKIMVIKFN